MQDSKLLSNTCAEHIYNYSKTAATGPLPIERALKSDVVSILAIYQQQYSKHIYIKGQGAATNYYLGTAMDSGIR